MNVVYTNIRRADRAVVDGLAAFGVATVHEAQGRTGLLAPRMRPIYRGARIAGSAVTVSVAPCDNWMIHVAVEQCRDGDILVVAPTSPPTPATSASCWRARCWRAACAGSSSTRACATCATSTAMRFPVWSKRGLRAGHGQGDARQRQRPGRLRGRCDRTRRRRRRRRRRRLRRAAPRAPQRVLKPCADARGEGSEGPRAPQGGRARPRHLRHAREARRAAASSIADAA